MGVVYVTNLKTSALAGQTTWPECRNTPLVRDFRQWVGLIQELRQLAGSKKGVDHRRKGTGIDQVNRSKDLVVTYVHPFPDGTRHTRQTYPELSVQLLTYGAYPAVFQVINVVDFCHLVHQGHQETNDGDDVFFRQHQYLFRDIQLQFLVDLVAPYFTQVVAFIREEQLLDDATCRFFIGGISTAQLAIDVLYRFQFRTGRVLLQGIIDNGVILFDVFFLQDDRSHRCFQDCFNVVFVQNGITFQNDLIPFDGHHFTRILIHKVFGPAAQYTGSQFAANAFFERLTGSSYFIGQVKDIQDSFVGIVTDGTQQGSNREFLFPVDVRIHHCVDVGSKFHPGAFERNNPGRINFGTVGVYTLAKKYPW